MSSPPSPPQTHTRSPTHTYTHAHTHTHWPGGSYVQAPAPPGCLQADGTQWSGLRERQGSHPQPAQAWGPGETCRLSALPRRPEGAGGGLPGGSLRTRRGIGGVQAAEDAGKAFHNLPSAVPAVRKQKAGSPTACRSRDAQKSRVTTARCPAGYGASGQAARHLHAPVQTEASPGQRAGRWGAQRAESRRTLGRTSPRTTENVV